MKNISINIITICLRVKFQVFGMKKVVKKKKSIKSEKYLFRRELRIWGLTFKKESLKILSNKKNNNKFSKLL